MRRNPVMHTWLFRGALLAAMCIAVLAASGARAQSAVPLPGATGVFEQELVAGVVEMPGALAAGPTVLKVRGSLAPGTVQYCDREGDFPDGSEIHLYVGPGCGDFVVATAHAEIAAEAGEFVIAVPMLGFSGSPIDLSIIAGPTAFEFHVGYHPEETRVCETVVAPAVVTVEAVELVSENELPSDRPAWGAIKALYR